MVLDFVKEVVAKAESTKDAQFYIDESEESNCINWELLNLKVERELKEDVDKLLKERKEVENGL